MREEVQPKMCGQKLLFSTYETLDLKNNEIFVSGNLSICFFCEDPSMATYGKITWKQFNVYLMLNF